ncbi:outer membrane autotransporter barrel domain protein [Chthoniobacter flavus Ellin428]|uniref:Outer membrane autotransporter barrel domain protein n=1 Tax=Chthoniobacter flavus Ellin428 TaxID=497964 RepID=B4D8D6_9BACT|nr:autotransporter outer membrane beta-barrel domain-containing protein [Chthoniobacter flavus]EDY17329.1 outer membrane autotransporter barrel domain protein [Chthoniobacter flavus Ellin428]
MFQLPYVPIPSFVNSPFSQYRPLANGQTVVLIQGPGLPLLSANSLTFLGNYTLVSGHIAVDPNYVTLPLALTSGNITVGDGFTATINNPLTSGSGTITKLGDGTLVLEQAVQSSLLVQRGILRGSFSVTGNLTNHATLSPGNSPGTISVQGNFQQSRAGTLDMEVASPSSYDRLQIGGKAALDGQLNVTLLNGFRPKKGEKFTILTAGSGVSGEFSKTDLPTWDLLALRVFYGGNDVFLKAVVNSFGDLPGLTPNQQAVGHSVDQILNDPRETKLVNYLYDRSLNQLPGDLDRLAPEELTSVFSIGVAYANVQAMNLQRRTEDIRNGASGFSAANLAINGDGPSYSGSFGTAGPNGDDGKDSKEPKVLYPAENRWGVFLSGTGDWVSVGDDHNARGYDLNSGGFTLGVDYKVCPNFAIGLAAGYTGTTADLVDGGRVWMNGGKLGLYATTFAGGWYADVAAFGGYNSFDTKRAALQGDARGNTDGGEVDALFGTGYDFKAHGFTFGPTATFNYTYVGMNGFTEHGSLAPLDIHSGKGESIRTAFGAKASYDWKVGGIVIKPEVRVAWQHEYGDSTYDLGSSFANGAAGSFVVQGPRLGRDSLLLGAGFAIQCSERCSTYFYYDGELGRTNYQSNAVTGGIRVAF